MDVNGLGAQGHPTAGIPLGFGMALAMNEPAMRSYAGLTETEREHIIMKCKDARSKEEMQKIVDSLVPDGNVSSLYEHTQYESSRGEWQNETAEG